MVAVIHYAEPSFTNSEPTEQSILVNVKDMPLQECDNPGLPVIKSQTVRLGDFVDTDAVSFTHYLPTCRFELLHIEIRTIADMEASCVARAWASIDKLCDRRGLWATCA